MASKSGLTHLGGLAVVSFLVLTASASAETAINARGWTHSSFGRLVFDRASKIVEHATIDGDKLVIVFDQAVEVRFGSALNNLPTYLAPNVQASGNQVVLTLKQPATFKQFDSGGNFVIDLTPAKSVAATEEFKAKPFEPTVKPFEPKPLAPLAAESKKSEAKPAAPKELGVKVPEVKSDEAKPAVAAVTAEPPEAEQPAQTKPAETKPVEVKPATTAPAAGSSEKVENAAATEPRRPPIALESILAMPEPEPPAVSGAAHVEPAAETSLPNLPPVEISLQTGATRDGAELVFVWPAPVAAATFQSGDSLLLVFDRVALFESARLSGPALQNIGTIKRLDSSTATILQITGSAPLGIQLTSQTASTWVARVTVDGSSVPKIKPDLRRETLAEGGTSMLLKMKQPGRPVEIAGDAGDTTLVVVPVPIAGLGMGETVDGEGYQLLPTHQGIVVAKSSSSVRVDSLQQGVVITTRPSQAQEPAAVAAQELVSPEQLIVEGRFDLSAWRGGGEATFYAERRVLEGRALDASQSQDGSDRFELAKFLFAHGLLAETKAELNTIDTDGQSLPDRQLANLILGATEFLLGKADKAEEIFSDPKLNGIPEAALFRGAIAAAKGDWKTATELFTGPLPAIVEYPKPARDSLGLLAATALAQGGNPLAGQRFADAVRRDHPNAIARDRLAYVDGLIQMKLGKVEEGFAIWEMLGDSLDDEVRAKATLAVVDEKLRTGKMTPEEALAKLELIRFAWRGGDFEFALLRKLGNLYLDVADARQGLLLLRQAATNFPKHPDSPAVAKDMSDAFRRLYLEGEADQLSPLTAVALYDEFRELTPPGADGDRMITALADRLVKVDLLDRAGELLTNQITKRLSGQEKLKAGTQLAAIRLLDRKPDLALKALELSEIGGKMPEEIAAERRQLKAQALFETGASLEAIALLADDESKDAMWLRADIHWRTKEWPAAANALSDLIEAETAELADTLAKGRPKEEDLAKNPMAAVTGNLSPEDLSALKEKVFKEKIAPLVLNRAVALTLAKDRRGLKALAKEFGEPMAKTDQASAFAMLTAPDQGLVGSISSEMESINRIQAFVDDYRQRLALSSGGGS